MFKTLINKILLAVIKSYKVFTRFYKIKFYTNLRRSALSCKANSILQDLTRLIFCARTLQDIACLTWFQLAILSHRPVVLARDDNFVTSEPKLKNTTLRQHASESLRMDTIVCVNLPLITPRDVSDSSNSSCLIRLLAVTEARTFIWVHIDSTGSIVRIKFGPNLWKNK